ncbi:predicted protein [Naegleria gruberi]|uniref:Predicted protein n=1 Tax=Naegleria gruberi TaxID=5762 RepID=D2VE34_NAEGR|nr:uncharacterized protein NAEGRDRAFT_67134 [Naegleria gruberi]EFC45010.1 predicted protein [Naegleria gruberi]|eukprot:XP_002677754.1 predicted protein [Naegleria gruberi strain NEG-M]
MGRHKKEKPNGIPNCKEFTPAMSEVSTNNFIFYNGPNNSNNNNTNHSSKTKKQTNLINNHSNSSSSNSSGSSNQDQIYNYQAYHINNNITTGNVGGSRSNQTSHQVSEVVNNSLNNSNTNTTNGVSMYLQNPYLLYSIMNLGNNQLNLSNQLKSDQPNHNYSYMNNFGLNTTTTTNTASSNITMNNNNSQITNNTSTHQKSESSVFPLKLDIEELLNSIYFE